MGDLTTWGQNHSFGSLTPANKPPVFDAITAKCHFCHLRILVGAPQAAGQGRLRGSRPGALFRCPVTPEEYDCERVDIDGDGEWTPTDFVLMGSDANLLAIRKL